LPPPLKVLLDECIDRRLARSLPGHAVKTVPQMHWSGLKDGALLAAAAQQFDVFITVDRNLAFQQHLPAFTIAVLVLQARTNRLADLLALVPSIEQALREPVAGVAITLRVEARE
jgi:predicted nuclease of predicted toxin-antitoxin system